MNYDVFISCKSEDYPLAKPIYDYLVECGLVVFLASEELRNRGVAFYGEIIDEALDSADHMIVFASKAEYVTTPYVSYEWRTFAEELRSGRKGGNIVTVLKGVSVPKLPIGLRNYQSFNYNDYRDVVSYLDVKSEGVIPPQPTPTPTPQPAPEPKPQPTPTVKTYKVGDLYDDGTKRGVVFQIWDNGRHGKIVSLEEARKHWAIMAVFSDMTDATSMSDGKANMQKIMAISGWREKYPAFAWCADLGEGWYLPAQDELLAIYKARGKINATLSANGCTKLNLTWYWSSSENSTNEFCAWYVFMYDGDTNNDLYKFGNLYVRAVSAF